MKHQSAPLGGHAVLQIRSGPKQMNIQHARTAAQVLSRPRRLASTIAPPLPARNKARLYRTGLGARSVVHDPHFVTQTRSAIFCRGGAVDVPDAPDSRLARRYAESGTLTQAPTMAVPQDLQTQQSHGRRRETVNGLSQPIASPPPQRKVRGGQCSASWSTPNAQPPGMREHPSHIIDGRSLPLTAQSSMSRSAIASGGAPEQSDQLLQSATSIDPIPCLRKPSSALASWRARPSRACQRRAQPTNSN